MPLNAPCIKPKEEREQALLLAEQLRLPVTPGKGGEPCVDGMRWDYWLVLRNRETTEFRGAGVVKVL